MVEINKDIKSDSGPLPVTPAAMNIGPTPAQQAWDTPVRTLEDIKNVLIDHLGEDKGMKLYNFFLSSIITSTFTSMQGSTQRAQEAAKKMSQSDPSQG